LRKILTFCSVICGKGKQVLDSLTGRTIQALKAHIGNGQFESGAKLGSLAELSERFGVSRTVIREAVSALRSDGIVESRHGVGVFVRKRPGPDIEDANSLDANITLAPLARLQTSFMDLLELRMAFEVHAAGLAAVRRSWSQESNIWNAARAFEASLEDEAALDHLDFVFHRSIAEATNNGAFIEFFSLMSLQILPQPAFSKQLNPALITLDYIQNTVVEHRSICEAISSGSAERAREAMRAHLSRSHLRYRGFSDGDNSPLSNIASEE
jgi:GntR family transcriptional repressor for pyruvate dehydrogenase complex